MLKCPPNNRSPRVIKKLIPAITALLPSLAFATTVQFQTVLGDIEVELFDETTPATVANFLSYVEEGDYSDSIIHRSVPNFVVQGGGFMLNSENKITPIATHPPVVNEPIYANVRGTIAMAKLGNLPNSATNQWFFNLGDNTANLDNQNGGFTVFGQVTKGMDVVDAISDITVYDAGAVLSAFNAIPLRDWAAESQINNRDHLVLINNIAILDAASDTAADLTPKTTTRRDAEVKQEKSGGSLPFSVLGLLMLGVIARRRCLT